MARYKLVQYLNDPSLLLSTSLEELRSWAEEAPYSAIIRKLIAQKELLENSSPQAIEKANALAILSSANPEHTIKSISDFKEMMLHKDGNYPSPEEIDDAHAAFSRSPRMALARRVAPPYRSSPG